MKGSCGVTVNNKNSVDVESSPSTHVPTTGQKIVLPTDSLAPLSPVGLNPQHSSFRLARWNKGKNSAWYDRESRFVMVKQANDQIQSSPCRDASQASSSRVVFQLAVVPPEPLEPPPIPIVGIGDGSSSGGDINDGDARVRPADFAKVVSPQRSLQPSPERFSSRALPPPRDHRDTHRIGDVFEVSDPLLVGPSAFASSAIDDKVVPSDLSPSTRDLATSPRAFSLLRLESVRDVFRRLLASNALDIGDVRRQLSRRRQQRDEILQWSKPSALKVQEMVNSSFFRAGDRPLPEQELVLDINFITQGHMLHCVKCQEHGGIADDCYFSTLSACITNGFNPVVQPDSSGVPVARYHGQGLDGNHRSVDGHPVFVQSQIVSMLARGAISECRRDELPSLNALGVAIPQSSVRQAEILTGIKVVDEASLDAAKAVAAERGLQLRLKQRLILDMKQSGANDMFEKLPFSYVGPEQVANMITQNCYLFSCDAIRYYYNFMTAQPFRQLTGFVYEGKCYRYNSLPFGASPAPMLVSGMSAEFGAIIKARGVNDCVWILDDFMAKGDSLEEALYLQSIMENTLKSCGIRLEESKRVNPTREIVFMGIKYNSETMSTSVNPSSAELCAASLEVIINTLEGGGELSDSVAHHMCGKLTDYSKVCQQGKTKIHAAWRYLKYGADLWPSVRVKLIADLKWWIAKLTLWSTGASDGCYPIVNCSTLVDNPTRIGFLISDYSGTDGFGGLSGSLDTIDPRFFALQHPDSRVKESSFVGELKVLLHELTHDLNEITSSMPSGVTPPPPLPCLLLVWVTDNEAAAYAVNSGHCTDDVGHGILEDIFHIANTLRRSLLAIWVPREENSITDNLSHFASLLNVREIEGRFSDLPAHISDGPGSYVRGQDPSEAIGEAGGFSLREIRNISPSPATANGFRSGGLFPHPVHVGQRRSHSIAEECAESSPHSTRCAGTPLVNTKGGETPCEAVGSVSAGGYHPGQSQKPPANSHHLISDQQVEPQQRVGTPLGDSLTGGDPGPPAYEGGDGRNAGVGFHLEEQRSFGGHQTRPYQDKSSRRWGLRGAGGQRQPDLCIQASMETLLGAGPLPKTGRHCLLHGSEPQAVPSHQGFGRGLPVVDQAHRSIHWSEPRSLQRSFVQSGWCH